MNMEYVKYGAYILIILVVFYFTVSVEKRKSNKVKKMQQELKVGDRIITYTGLCGTVVELLEDRVIIEANPDKVRLSIEKWAIAGLDDRDIY